MARKNGKTELAAGLALCHLCGPEAELNGQVYSAAADRFQAALVYNAAAAMVRADPELDSTQGGLLTIVDSQKRIVCHQNGSFYQALSSESKTKHGFNASCIIYDELAQAPNRHLFDVLTTSTGARAQPLTLVISTQSPDPHSVMTELVEYGRKVEAGAFPDASFRMFLYEIPDEMDVWDEANWPLANPALGDFRSLEEMRVKAAQARRLPSAEMAFRNLYCNQRIDAEARFVPPTVWRACAATLELASFRGRQCWAALDLSAVHDLTALSVVFPRGVNEFDALAWFWLPAEGLRDKADQDRVPYPEWQAAGWLETIPGRAIRKDVVARRVADILSPFDCRQLFCDPWRIEEFMPHWSDLGVPIPLEEFQQTYRSFGPAVDTLERALLDQRLRHQGSPILTWHIANVVVTADSAGNRKFDKSKSTARIDGAVALLMALQRASSALDLRSPYERQGITVLN